MAPEQLQSMLAANDGRPAPPVGPTADIYALGVVLHVALTDKPPRHGGRIAAPMRRANPRVSAGLAEIVAHCLATDPRQRYPDAALLADDLRRHLDDLPDDGGRQPQPAGTLRQVAPAPSRRSGAGGARSSRPC